VRQHYETYPCTFHVEYQRATGTRFKCLMMDLLLNKQYFLIMNEKFFKALGIPAGRNSSDISGGLHRRLIAYGRIDRKYPKFVLQEI